MSGLQSFAVASRRSPRGVLAAIAMLFCMFALAAQVASAAGIGTGDPVIDEAQQVLTRITSSKENLNDAKLNEALGLLFARPAFEGIREEGWRYMLFTLIKTRELIEHYAPRYSNPKQRSGLAQVTQSMTKLQDQLVGLYGPKFSLDEHLKRYPNNRDAFTQNLPTPPQAPNSQFFNACDTSILAIRAQLKSLNLVEF